MKKIFFCLLFLVVLGLWGVSATLAQETTADVSGNSESIDLNSETAPIAAEELDAVEPKVLPNSPWYWAKSLWRGLREVATLDPVKKAQYRLQIANEKLLEVQALASQVSREQLAKILAKYGKEIEKLKTALDKAQAKSETKAKNLRQKFGQQELARQRLFQRLEEKFGSSAIEQAREKAKEKFGEIVAKADAEKLGETIEKKLKEQTLLFNLHNLEVLKGLEEKVPEAAKEALQRAEENALNRLEAKLKGLTDEEKKAWIDKYLAADDDEARLEMIKKLGDISTNNGLKNQIEKTERAVEKIRVKANGDCVCIEVYLPVCGENGQTYGNACEARCARAGISHKGECASNSGVETEQE